MNKALFSGRFLVVLVHIFLLSDTMAQSSPAPKRDIDAVLTDHDQRLLALPNVTGVYVGVLPDGKTPCLKVMLVRKLSTADPAIPSSLEGYPVVTEVTGPVRPRRTH